MVPLRSANRAAGVLLSGVVWGRERICIRNLASYVFTQLTLGFRYFSIKKTMTNF